MASIFGPLDKRQRQATDSQTALETDLSFEDRADLLNDILEDDTSIFPLLGCPHEVLASVLLLSDVSAALRIRPVCCQMRGSIDSNTGFWSSLIIRDFADMGGSTKHYRGLRTLADAWDGSKAVARLEWDPLMICAPPPLRYTLLAASKTRRRKWDGCGPSLGCGWAWFSSKVCRRMATSTFLRWAALQHGQEAAERLVRPTVSSAEAGGGTLSQPPQTCDPDASTDARCSADGGAAGSTSFRNGRSDAVSLSDAAVADIYETVQRWHDKAHRDMMRAHFKSDQDKAPDKATVRQRPEEPMNVGEFSATPTLDAAEANIFASGVQIVSTASPNRRGQASNRIEEAQLRLALELSKAEAESADGGPSSSPVKTAAGRRPNSSPCNSPPSKETCTPSFTKAAADRPEPACLTLRCARDGCAPMIFLKPYCLAEAVDHLPESMDKSIEHIVHKMSTSMTWGLLYESVTEELGFRAKCAAQALSAAHGMAMDELIGEDISLKQERMCLPIWRSSCESMRSLSRLRQQDSNSKVRERRRELVRQTSLEWCELEDLTAFLDSQLAPLELAIDNFRGEQEVSSKAHTPHIRDMGRLMFRNFCLLDSKVFRPLCLAAYALVHEVHAARASDGDPGPLLDLLETMHAMLVGCDVADDDLSLSAQTKDAYVEHLVQPISAALEALSPTMAT